MDFCLVDFRKYYSGYASKMEQVSLKVGDPYLGVSLKKATALVLRAGKGTSDRFFCPFPSPDFSHYFPTTNWQNRVYCANCDYKVCESFR